jgi:hypothetical protein
VAEKNPMNKTDTQKAQRLAAFMYGLINFVQENKGLVNGVNPPIRFLPQLQPYLTVEGPLRSIRQAVCEAEPYPEKVTFFQIWITWDEASRTLTFSAPAEALVAVTPKVVNLSDEGLERMYTSQPVVEVRAPKPGEPTFLFDEDAPLPEAATA